jgi:hypothetical protein
MGATMSLFSGVKPEPPELAKLDVPALNRMGIPVIDLKEDRIYSLSHELHPEKILVKLSWISKVREDCKIVGYRWNGAAFEVIGEMDCGLGEDNPTLSLDGEANAPKDMNDDLLFPGNTVIMINGCGAHPPGYTDYYLVRDDSIQKTLTVHENESILRGDWDGDGVPDFKKNGSTFSCSRLQPSYMSEYSSYLILDPKSGEWDEMQSLQPPDFADTAILEIFRKAEKQRMVQDRAGALAALHAIQKRLPKDVNIRRDIIFVELTVPECEKPGRSVDRKATMNDKQEGWAGAAIEGDHGEILDHLRKLPVKRLFSSDLAKRMFSDKESGDDYVSCALEKLQWSPSDDFCDAGDPRTWFLHAWAAQQSGHGKDEILPDLRKAVELAPRDDFYRSALAEYERISAASPDARP